VCVCWGKGLSQQALWGVIMYVWHKKTDSKIFLRFQSVKSSQKEGQEIIKPYVKIFLVFFVCFGGGCLFLETGSCCIMPSGLNSDPPVPTSQVLGSQVCANTPRIYLGFIYKAQTPSCLIMEIGCFILDWYAELKVDVSWLHMQLRIF
jgi:hypothetical protein